MANSELIDIVLIAVAGFFLFRLYTVLGRRTGHERPPQDSNLRFQPDPKAPPAEQENVLAYPKRAEIIDGRPADPVARGLTDIGEADRGFETEHFLAGSRQAYETIVTAYTRGDRAELKPLLSDEVYRAFETAIAAREAAKETIAFTFVGFKDAKIVQARLNGRTAEITVAFGAQFISATSDAEGKVVEGDARSVRDVTDVWTFSRDTRARDPNWTLVATSGDLPQ
ncbi:MAG: Tim44 domain-containing protein [Alphaproteobacteria bacterium]|nr:Tim44 domain-containing protein [Alphaproteobacteria bacterium]